MLFCDEDREKVLRVRKQEFSLQATEKTRVKIVNALFSINTDRNYKKNFVV